MSFWEFFMIFAAAFALGVIFGIKIGRD